MATYFVTGATGLIGRELVERLIDRGGDITLLVRSTTAERLADHVERWSARASARGATLTVVNGDVTSEGLGLSDPFDAATDHVYHVAGYYDVTGDPARMRSVNVDGTRHLLEVLQAADFGGVLHYVSSVAVAGDFSGDFAEDELDQGQRFNHEYHRSKYDAEALVRASSVKHRIYRPSAVVGHSQTGEMDRVDGPYFLFKAVQKIGYALPGWFPMWGWTKEQVNMVPVDWVAAVLDVVGHQPGHDGKTFHVADPDPLTMPQLYNALAKITGAPKITKTFGGKSKFLPGARDMIASLGATKFLREQLMGDFDIPPEVSTAKNADVSYSTTNLEAAIADAGIDCPRPERYLPALWHYWALHLDPDREEAIRWRDAFAGKKVLITGASSGIGEALATKCAEVGAHVICVARREELLEDLVSRITEQGGSADYFVADLAELEGADALIAAVLERHGGVDILVNNAAKSIRRSIAESYDRIHDYERTMRLNYLSPVRLCLGFLPSMVANGGGHIVSVLTAGAGIPSPRFSAYTASKAALGQFTDTLSAEYLHENVHTTSAYLSWVVTPMMTATDKYADKAKREDIMTPERAAEWLMDGVAQRKRKLFATETLRRFVWSVVFPKFMTRALSVVFQVYHDDREQFPQFEFDRMAFKQVFKTDPI